MLKLGWSKALILITLLFLVGCPEKNNLPQEVKDTTSPTISLAASSLSVNKRGDLILTATATDNKGVSKVEFYEGANKIGEDTTVTDGFKHTFSLTSQDNGAKNYTAKAYDVSENAVISKAIKVTIDIPVSGSLDKTFGEEGRVFTNLDGEVNLVNVAIQKDNKIIVGVRENVTYDDYYDYFVLFRYNPDGSLDGAFGTNGRVATKVGFGLGDVTTIALQSDGKILLGGYSGSRMVWADPAPIPDYDFVLLRYNSDGSLDEDFGSDGMIFTDFGSKYDQAFTVLPQSDGKIVLGGLYLTDIALARYNSDGSLDESFGTNGKTVLDPGYAMYAPLEDLHFVLQDDNKILVAASGGYKGNYFDLALTRLQTNGSADSTFGENGLILTDFGYKAYPRFIHVQENRNIVVGGLVETNVDYDNHLEYDFDFAVSRYDDKGAMDTEFGQGGKAVKDLNLESGLDGFGIVQDDGKVVMGSIDYSLVRFDADGSLDKTFGIDGRTPSPSSANPAIGHSLVLQEDNKIVVVGVQGEEDLLTAPSSIVLFRFNP